MDLVSAWDARERGAAAEKDWLKRFDDYRALFPEQAARQPAAYREQVLPLRLPAVAVEAAQPDFWHKYVGREGAVIGIASFGESAPAKDLYAHFGITAAHVAQQVRRLMQQRAPHPVLAPAVELAPAK